MCNNDKNEINKTLTKKKKKKLLRRCWKNNHNSQIAHCNVRKY